MKSRNLLILLVFSLTSGCILIGKRVVYSPQSSQGKALRYGFFHIHGHETVTRKSPPDFCLLNIEGQDSSGILVSSKPIRRRVQWGGVMLPVFPIWMVSSFIKTPKHDSLTIYIQTNLSKTLRLIPDSIQLQTKEGKMIKPVRVILEDANQVFGTGQYLSLAPDTTMDLTESIWSGYEKLGGSMGYASFYEPPTLSLVYPLKTREIKEFSLIFRNIYLENEFLDIKPINFQRARQRYVWFALGP